MTDHRAVLPVVLLAAWAAGCTGGGTDDTARRSAPAGATAETPATARVEVTTNHCFVEPVTFDGEEWNVRIHEQFGSGGGMPARWRGTGVVERVDDDEARYTDDGGAIVVLWPVDHPSVRPVETALCD